MQNIQELLSKYIEQKQNSETNAESARSEYEELIKKFAKKLNDDRRLDGFKPLLNSFIGMKMSDANLKGKTDLYWFYRYCEDAKNFGKTWWWSLKAK